MDAGILMVILTMLPGGGVSSSFVNVDTLPQCETRLQRIRPVLEGGTVELKAAGCYRNDIQFDDFDHDPPKDAPRFNFLVELHDGEADITRTPDADACLKALAEKPADQGRQAWCTTSIQDIAARAG